MKLLTRMVEHERLLTLAVIPVFLALLVALVGGGTAYWFKYWWMFPVALLIATVVNTVGISGAALFVPFFVLVFPVFADTLTPEQTVKVGLITESFGLSSSALAFLRYGLIDRKIGAYAVLAAVPFVVAGALLSFTLPAKAFRVLVALALLGAVYLMLSRERVKAKIDSIEHRFIDVHHPRHTTNVEVVDREGNMYYYCRCGYKTRAVGYGVGGLFQGMAGFGIGELGIVSMMITEIPVRIAIGTSHMVVALTAIVASAVHLLGSQVEQLGTPWNLIAMTVPAVIVGGQVAPYIAARLKVSLMEYMVAALFVVMSLLLVVTAFK